MKYLDIKNGKCEGWTVPTYYFEAVAFAKEVKQICMFVRSGTGDTLTPEGKIKKVVSTNYKFQDGTRFIIQETPDGELFRIETKDIYSGDWETVYCVH